MFSYNNIVLKGEPSNKNPIDHALDGFTTVPKSTQRQAAPGVDCIVVDDFLSPEECDAIIAACESVGYTFWRQEKHEESDGEQRADAAAKAVRVVDTIEANFPTLSQRLFERIASVVELAPKHFSKDMDGAEELYQRDLDGTWVASGLSENLLLGRYHPGGHFMPHIDGSTITDLNTRSFYTLLIYLNDCRAGGETFLFSGDQCDVMFMDDAEHKYRGRDANRVGHVSPKKGSAAFFYYDLLHEGAPVGAGELKYICRADVVYKRTPPILTSENDQRAFEIYQEARLAESSGDAARAGELFQKVRKVSRGVAQIYQVD